MVIKCAYALYSMASYPLEWLLALLCLCMGVVLFQTLGAIVL